MGVFRVRRTNNNRGYFWSLQAANGQILCHSEEYTTKQAALDGIAAVKRLAPGAPISDET